MKVSDYIAKFLEWKKVKYVFELSGGMITHLLDSLSQKTAITIVTVHHEQSAAFAADVVGRITGIPGVAMATSGPGATNLLTGIANAYFDSSPAVFITGQVNRHEQKGNKNIRQLGFQETDIVSMATPITKKSYAVKDAAAIPAILNEAFAIATEGRPGPVLIDIPMDVQRADIDANPEIHPYQPSKKEVSEEIKASIHALAAALRRSEKPMLLVGRGLKASFANDEFRKFLSLTKIPVITTLLAIDALSYNHAQKVGFIGSYGNRWANIAFGECDLLIVAGSRLDIRQTGADTKYFENREIYHVDCEPGEVNNRIKGCTALHCDVKEFFDTFNSICDGEQFAYREDWYRYIQSLKHQWPDTKELNTTGLNPNSFMHLLSAASGEASAFLADVGAHQMWAAQSLQLREGQWFLTSAGMGAMGFALPASIGSSLAFGGKPVVAIIGDGCMQLNIQELQTIVRNDLPVKIVVMNNKNLGMIRQFQDSYFESRYTSTYWGYSAPDFEKIATAYGIAARTIADTAEVKEGVEWLWSGELKNKPVLLQVMIDPLTNCYPKIAFGKPITEMEPLAMPMDMEGT